MVQSGLALNTCTVLCDARIDLACNLGALLMAMLTYITATSYNRNIYDIQQRQRDGCGDTING